MPDVPAHHPDADRWLTQTILHEGDPTKEPGNCLAACVASLLHRPLASVPNFIADPTFPENMYSWLRSEGYGYVYCWIDLWAEKQDRPVLAGESLRRVMRKLDTKVTGYHIIIGNSPRGDWTHAVVGYDGELVHDPHPSRAGIGEVQAIVLIYPLDPACVVPAQSTRP